MKLYLVETKIRVYPLVWEPITCNTPQNYL